MSILQRSLTNGNVKTKNIFGEKEPNVFFHDNIKSTNLKKFLFTNYLDNKKVPLVKALQTERRRILRKEVNYEEEYEIKNIEYRKNEKNKIDAILFDTIGIEKIDYSMLWRLKYKYNPAIQFFFLDDFHGNYEVLIVDIYHLVCPAPDREHGEIFANPKKTYKDHKDAKYNINNIFHK